MQINIPPCWAGYPCQPVCHRRLAEGGEKMAYYYVAYPGGEPRGPVTPEVIREWLENGLLQPGWLACPVGGREWVDPASIPELAGLVASPPPPPPPPPPAPPAPAEVEAPVEPVTPAPAEAATPPKAEVEAPAPKAPAPAEPPASAAEAAEELEVEAMADEVRRRVAGRRAQRLSQLIAEKYQNLCDEEGIFIPEWALEAAKEMVASWPKTSAQRLAANIEKLIRSQAVFAPLCEEVAKIKRCDPAALGYAPETRKEIVAILFEKSGNDIREAISLASDPSFAQKVADLFWVRRVSNHQESGGSPFREQNS